MMKLCKQAKTPDTSEIPHDLQMLIALHDVAGKMKQVQELASRKSFSKLPEVSNADLDFDVVYRRSSISSIRNSRRYSNSSRYSVPGLIGGNPRRMSRSSTYSKSSLRNGQRAPPTEGEDNGIVVSGIPSKRLSASVSSSLASDNCIGSDSEAIDQVQLQKLTKSIWPTRKRLTRSKNKSAKVVAPRVFADEDLELVAQPLGAGRFGTVQMGNACGRAVAVKEAQPGEEQTLLMEALLTAQVSHKHVIELVGVAGLVEANSLKIILHLCEHGDLLGLLRGRADRELAPYKSDQATNICFQVASGMAYLEEKRFVHRDLAARNVLVDSGMVFKVADLGMGQPPTGAGKRSIAASAAKREPIPVRWCAPEALIDQIFSHASDSWAFGVLAFEIFTSGKSPYPDLIFSSQVLVHVIEHNILDQPDDCPDWMWSTIFKRTLSYDAEDRPSFKLLKAQLKSFRKSKPGEPPKNIPRNRSVDDSGGSTCSRTIYRDGTWRAYDFVQQRDNQATEKVQSAELGGSHAASYVSLFEIKDLQKTDSAHSGSQSDSGTDKGSGGKSQRSAARGSQTGSRSFIGSTLPSVSEIRSPDQKSGSGASVSVVHGQFSGASGAVLNFEDKLIIDHVWSVLQAPGRRAGGGVQSLGNTLFRVLFELYPAALDLFPKINKKHHFTKTTSTSTEDSTVDENDEDDDIPPLFREHTKSVVMMLTKLIAKLHDVPALVKEIFQLGFRHANYITDENLFPCVADALCVAISRSLDGQVPSNALRALKILLDIVVENMESGMKAGKKANSERLASKKKMQSSKTMPSVDEDDTDREDISDNDCEIDSHDHIDNGSEPNDQDEIHDGTGGNSNQPEVPSLPAESIV